ncbi:MAG: HAMP domain-containing sensor histidine kinase [Candidatus Peribacteraceae bacterium]|jgi:signal transduction histidine kinase
MPNPPVSFNARGNRAQSITVILLVLAAVITVTTLMLLFMRGREFMEFELKQRLRSVAAVAASQIDAEDVARINTRADTTGPAFREVVQRMKGIMKNAVDVSSVYIMRKTEDPNTLAFVADAISLDSFRELDTNGDGVLQPDEEAPQPGDPYDVSALPELRELSFLGPAVDEGINSDQWGTVISGYAPIRDAKGEAKAILGIDMNADDYVRLSGSVFSSFLFLLLLVGATSIAGGIALLLLERKMTMYQQLERERMGLLLLASHQLGEPLTIFKYSAEALQDELGSSQLKDAVKDHIASLNEGVYRMNNILNVMKQAAKIEEQGVEVHPAWFYMDALIRDVRVACEPYLRRREQTMDIAVEGDMRAWTDSHLVTSILMELLDNAMGYSPKGTLITVKAERLRNRVRIAVRDHGYGIPPADLPRLFTKFVRGTNARLHRPDGNGLGLFIVQGILRCMGGRIWLESDAEQGTTFTFELPVEPEEVKREVKMA